ncbi:hypothetical protein [Micromonospora zamorensis]|uniref:hypothetical protein n=1 Tax=Micromonospora zamorensis TaxID=709883 RepID=UPI0037A519CF
MKMIRRSMFGIVAALGLVLAGPAGGASAHSDVASAGQLAAAYTRNCPSGSVVSIANNLPVRAGIKISSPIFHWGQKGWGYACTRNVYALGDRYTACGVSNANGWINVYVPEVGQWGYTYMTCLEDVWFSAKSEQNPLS